MRNYDNKFNRFSEVVIAPAIFGMEKKYSGYTYRPIPYEGKENKKLQGEGVDIVTIDRDGNPQNYSVKGTSIKRDTTVGNAGGVTGYITERIYKTDGMPIKGDRDSWNRSKYCTNDFKDICIPNPDPKYRVDKVLICPENKDVLKQAIALNPYFAGYWDIEATKIQKNTLTYKIPENMTLEEFAEALPSMIIENERGAMKAYDKGELDRNDWYGSSFALGPCRAHNGRDALVYWSMRKDYDNGVPSGITLFYRYKLNSFGFNRFSESALKYLLEYPEN